MSRLKNYVLGPKKFGFLVKNYVFSQILRTAGLNLGQNAAHFKQKLLVSGTPSHLRICAEENVGVLNVNLGLQKKHILRPEAKG